MDNFKLTLRKLELSILHHEKFEKKIWNIHRVKLKKKFVILSQSGYWKILCYATGTGLGSIPVGEFKLNSFSIQ